MNTTNTCRTVLLDDNPATADVFGAHAKIAAGIDHYIRHSRGGRALGLVGHWGSGKSTVIELLKARLDRDDAFSVFVFDAWAHEGDPLRRTFLERLIAHLTYRGWLDRTAWDTELQKLGGKLKRTIKSEAIRLTWFGSIASTSLLLVPVGAALFREILSHWSDASRQQITIAWVLMLAPLLTTITWVLIAWLAKRDLADATDFLRRPTSEQVTTETHEGANPTSIEFEDWLTRVLTEALDRGDRRLVIVLDNLDRVHEETAAVVWTALQTFVGSTRAAGVGLERTWFVVPYDKKRLSDHAGTTAQDVTRGFIQKKILAEFEVPEPLLTDWRGYLIARLIEAMPDHPLDEFGSVYDVFFAALPNEDVSPTPRTIKNFVNQLGILHHVRGHDFQLADMAYFVALRQRDVDVVAGILAKQIPTLKVRALTSEEVEVSLAALHFGVEATRAGQLLLSEPIHNAFKRGDGRKLRELSSIPGFQEVLDGARMTEWIDVDGATLPTACIALAEAGLLKAPPAYSPITSKLRVLMQRVEHWNLANTNVAPALATAVAIFSEPFAQRVIAQVGAFGATGHREATQLRLNEWSYGYAAVLEAIRKRGFKLPEASTVVYPGETASWVTVVREIATRVDESLGLTVRPPEGFKDVFGSVRELVVKEGVGSPGITPLVVRELIRQSPEAEWDKLWDIVQGRFQSSDVSDGPECVAILLEGATNSKRADKILRTLVEAGWVHHHLAAPMKRASPIAASLIAAMWRYGRLFAEPPGLGNAANGYSRLMAFLKSPSTNPELVRALVEKVGILSLADFLKDPSPAAETAELRRSMLLEFASQERLRELIGPDGLIKRWVMLKSILRDAADTRTVVQGLEAGELIAEILSSDFDPEKSDLYRACLPQAPDVGLQQWVAHGLSDLAPSELERAFRENSELVELVLDCNENELSTGLRRNFATAVLGVAKSIVSSGEPPQVLRLRIDRSVTVAKPSEGFLRDGLLDLLIEQRGHATEQFFALFATYLDSRAILSTSRPLVASLLNPIVSNHVLNGIRWATKLAETDRVGFSSLPHFAEFRDAVDSELSGGKLDEPTQVQLAILKTVIN